MHVIGSTGEGKSKFLEMLARQNIQAGYGCCFIDPTDRGETYYKILRYAIRKKYPKVCLIDPHDVQAFNIVPTINPIHYKTPVPVVTADIMDAMRILWASKDFSDTPRIERFLSALIKAIHAAGGTLADLKYFTTRTGAPAEANKILHALAPNDEQRNMLEAVFRNDTAFKDFTSTVNRIQHFSDETMAVVFGSKIYPINFQQLVAENYLILVNLDHEGVFGKAHQRLLGTLIINEISTAISRLRNSGWQGHHYLIIDEAGDYANAKISHILDKKRKSGLFLTIGHQRFDQFQERDVASAVFSGCKNKVMFATASRDDRDKMISMMYGGQLSDRDVSYHLSSLPKQNCIIKKNKLSPIKVRINDLPDVLMSRDEVDAWKEQHYKSAPWYRAKKGVEEEIRQRFARPTNTYKKDATDEPGPNSGRSGASKIPYNLTSSRAVLRNQKGRSTRKIVQDSPKSK